MTADSAPTSHAGAPGPAAAPAIKPSIRMLAQYVKEFAFNSPNAPRSLRATADQPNLQLDVGIGQSQVDRGVYEVVIRATGLATNKAGVLYDMKLSFAGLFEIVGFTPEQTQPVLFINCPALIFPFVRQMVGDMTRNGGFSPVWLDAIDWGGLYTQRIEALKAQPAPTSLN
jgi:preprotein translocase subunit SecB